MREFYPEQLALRNYVYNQVRRASEMFGYQEWEAPYVEAIDLYAAKSGEELVEKQSFVFTDRGGDQITLRPELTPSLARMIARKQNELAFPLRWWQFGPFWRYEQPQKGRSREFFQWNIDLLGADSPEADAELIAIGAEFLRSVGLRPAQAKILVSDRRLIGAEIAALGVPPEKRAGVAGLIDRRPKMQPEAWDLYALETGLSQEQLARLKKVLDDPDLWQKSAELKRVFAALDALGVADYVKFDANIIRGLLYYTGTVFEAYDVTGSVRRSIFGGGRYDNLLADVGGEPLPAVGFAMGDVVIGIILRENGLLPPFSSSPAPVLVTVFDDALWLDAYALAARLRAEGLFVIVYPEPAKLPKQFKYADRLGLRVAVVVGPDEAAAGQVTLKDLRKGEQRRVARGEAGRQIREILGQEAAGGDSASTSLHRGDIPAPE
jgi:histidyl-tRNA synthetase